MTKSNLEKKGFVLLFVFKALFIFILCVCVFYMRVCEVCRVRRSHQISPELESQAIVSCGVCAEN